MNTSALFSFLVVAGTIGLWLALSSALGGFEKLFRSIHASPLKSLDLDSSKDGEEDSREWPLSARIAKSFARLVGRAQGDRDLLVRLFQAGLPYYSPAHYWSRQVASALLYAAFGLANASAIALALHMPAAIVLTAAFGLGLIGAGQPAAEVRAKIRRRERELAMDMTYQLPRLVLLLEAYGSAQEAITAYVATAARGGLPEKERREAEKQAQTLSKEFAMDLAVALNGMGGNLFAELLNRVAAELTRSVRPEEIAAHMRLLFPPAVELGYFLDILVGGIDGSLPMKERLEELSHELRIDLRARQREAAQAANQVVILAAAAELLPIFAVVGAPVVFLAFRLFL